MFERLASVTAGGSTRQLLITRSPNVALGFNVRPDGIVTEVVKGGPADTGGLVPGARIMEICTVAVSTLTQVKKCECNLILSAALGLCCGALHFLIFCHFLVINIAKYFHVIVCIYLISDNMLNCWFIDDKSMTLESSN